MKNELCPHHTVPKLTPDVHTNMEFCISREDGPKLCQEPINSRSTMYREGHAMAPVPYAMAPEPYTMAPEPYTKATERWEFSLS